MYRFCANSFARCTVLSLSHVIVGAGMTFETMFSVTQCLSRFIHNAKPVWPLHYVLSTAFAFMLLCLCRGKGDS